MPLSLLNLNQAIVDIDKAIDIINEKQRDLVIKYGELVNYKSECYQKHNTTNSTTHPMINDLMKMLEELTDKIGENGALVEGHLENMKTTLKERKSLRLDEMRRLI